MIINSKFLLKSLEVAAKTVATNGVILSITECFYFSVKDNKMTIKSSDLNNSTLCVIDNVSGDISPIAIPSGIILKLLKSLPSQDLTLSLNDLVLNIKSSSGKYKINCESASDFPIVEAIDCDGCDKIDAAILSNGFATVIKFPSSGELDVMFNGIRIDNVNGKLAFAASNRVIMAIQDTDEDVKFEPFSLDKKLVGIIKDTFTSGDVVVKIDGNKVSFQQDGITISGILGHADFPPYRSILPEITNTAIVNKQQLLSALTRADLFSSIDPNLLELTFLDDKLVLNSKNEHGNETEEEVAAKFKGDVKGLLKCKMLLTIINSIPEQEVIFGIPDNPKAFIIKGEGNDSSTFLIALLDYV